MKLKFLYNSHIATPPIEIMNDDDVKFFVLENSRESSFRTPLCVSLERKVNINANVGIEEDSPHNSREEYTNNSPSFVLETEPQYNNEDDIFLTGVEEQNYVFEQFQQNTYGDEANEDNEFQNGTDEYFDFDILEESDISKHEEHIDIKVHEKSTIVGLQEEIVNVGTSKAMQSIHVGTSTQHISVSGFLNTDDYIEVDQLYDNRMKLQKKVSMLAMRKNFEFKVKKSMKDLLVLACIDTKCNWWLRTTKLSESTFFRIKKYIEGHTCSSDVLQKKHRQASS